MCGNEDCGQTSAWYVFSAMGFYPMNPISCEYETGTPLFDRVTLHLDNGKNFVIEAVGKTPDGYKVKDVELNGRRLKTTYITHKDLVKGGRLKFIMK